MERLFDLFPEEHDALQVFRKGDEVEMQEMRESFLRLSYTAADHSGGDTFPGGARTSANVRGDPTPRPTEQLLFRAIACFTDKQVNRSAQAHWKWGGHRTVAVREECVYQRWLRVRRPYSLSLSLSLTQFGWKYYCGLIFALRRDLTRNGYSSGSSFGCEIFTLPPEEASQWVYDFVHRYTKDHADDDDIALFDKYGSCVYGFAYLFWVKSKNMSTDEAWTATARHVRERHVARAAAVFEIRAAVEPSVIAITLSGPQIDVALPNGASMIYVGVSNPSIFKPSACVEIVRFMQVRPEQEIWVILTVLVNVAFDVFHLTRMLPSIPAPSLSPLSPSPMCSFTARPPSHHQAHR